MTTGYPRYHVIRLSDQEKVFEDVAARLSMMPSPLTPQQQAAFEQVVQGFSQVQRVWAAGFLAGNWTTVEANDVVASPIPVVPKQRSGIRILFGSQTGNAKGIATKLWAALTDVGINADVSDLASYKQASLKTEPTVIVITATYGEGEPPEGAELFHKWLMGKRAPELPGLIFTVLGLGDSSYEFFNKTAQDFDSRFEALGATRLLERAELDVDYAAGATQWISAVVGAIQALNPHDHVVAEPGTRDDQSRYAAVYTKENPFPAELLLNQKITGRRSEKDVRHIEISLEGSGLSYTAGDALGVWFSNAPDLVTEVLGITGANPAAKVVVSTKTLSLQDALTDYLELTQSYPGFVTKVAELTNDARYVDLASDKVTLRLSIADRQIPDILAAYPIALSPDQLVMALRPLQPRLYSIASSPVETPDEVHTTVAVVRFSVEGTARLGGASGFVGERLEAGATVRVYIEPNDHFRLPSVPETPIIMIGPGTGVAPFRAFLQHRDATSAAGANWLFFGNPHFTEDFLYQVELQDYLARGVLTHLDVAFSRDQPHKIYVQDKLRKHAAELYKWIQEGAHIYVCGDGQRMAKDVHGALIEMMQVQGGFGPDDAEDALDELRASGRYQRDVY